MYVINVLSGCYKSRSGVAHVTMAPVASRQWPTVGLWLLPRAAHLVLSSSHLLPLHSLPSLSFLPSISTRQFELGERDDMDA
jgi:hypothetical protein